ncbi:YeaC family protein [Pseudomonas fulva]|nr:DUF1315 family protein [Pseudomonas fulva]MBF8779311.1 DUF1315 family protein [Pseudomonas fulva]
MSTFAQMIENITPQIYESLKTAIELGKWADGRKLTQEQKELSLQALIAWELKHLPEEQRTGYMGVQACASKPAPIPNILFKSDSVH